MNRNTIWGHHNLRARLVEGIAKALKIDSPDIVPEADAEESVEFPTRPRSEFSTAHPDGKPSWDFLQVWDGNDGEKAGGDHR